MFYVNIGECHLMVSVYLSFWIGSGIGVIGRCMIKYETVRQFDPKRLSTAPDESHESKCEKESLFHRKAHIKYQR